MKPRALIFSHWTHETDLAALLGGWPEFVRGEAYDVDLRDGDDEIELRLVREDDDRWLLVSSNAACPLLDRVLGRVALAMARTSAIQLHAIDTPD